METFFTFVVSTLQNRATYCPIQSLLDAGNSLRLFTEEEHSSSQSANFYTGAHCRTYSSLQTKQEIILFH